MNVSKLLSCNKITTLRLARQTLTPPRTIVKIRQQMVAVSCLQESEITAAIDLAVVVDSETGFDGGCAPRRCRLHVRCRSSSSSSSSTRLLPYEEEMMDTSLRLIDTKKAMVEYRDVQLSQTQQPTNNFRRELFTACHFMIAHHGGYQRQAGYASKHLNDGEC